MKRLIQKMFRDIWQMKAQFASIFIMCFMGILIYSGIEGVWNGMQLEADKYFDETNLAEIWVNGFDIDTMHLAKIKNLDGVEAGQLSAIENAYLDSNQDSAIRLIANEKNDISKPVVIEGKDYDENGNGIWLDTDYAEEKNIQIGASITIYFDESKINLKVNGLVYSPEYISYTGSSTALMPNHGKYAYGYVSMNTLTDICGKSTSYNQVKLVTEDNPDEVKLKTDIQNILLGHYINSIDQLEWNGVSGYLNKIEQIQKMSVMFSLVFFLLTMLTIQTTMKRIVKKQRTQIGILKALGFYNYQIKVHYILYGLLTSITGVVLGIIIAPYTITPILLDLQKKFYSMPTWKGQVSYVSAVLAILMIIVCTFTALMSCSGIVKELPANLLRDESPSQGKKLWIENLRFFWNSIDFDWKWSFRDIFQNKARTLVGIVGVLGSMMLLMASFGIKDSINYVNRNVYGNQYSYYERFAIKKTIEEEKDTIEEILNGSFQWIYEGNSEVQSSNNKKTKNIIIMDQGFYMTLYDEKGEIVTLPQEGIVLAEKVAKELNVKKNSYININTMQGIYSFQVIKIVNINSPQGIFISKKAWEYAGGTFIPNVLLAGNSAKIPELEEMECIGEVSLLNNQLEESNEVLDSVRMIIFLLLAAAVLLSVVILYNLGILSYTERSREYATLRVLGFYNSEIKSLIFKDSIINVIIGWLLGIPAGYAFLNMYVQAVSTSAITYSPYLEVISFVLSTFIAVGCSLLVSYIVSRKVFKLDMVQSLKSVE